MQHPDMHKLLLKLEDMPPKERVHLVFFSFFCFFFLFFFLLLFLCFFVRCWGFLVLFATSGVLFRRVRLRWSGCGWQEAWLEREKRAFHKRHAPIIPDSMDEADAANLSITCCNVTVDPVCARKQTKLERSSSVLCVISPRFSPRVLCDLAALSPHAISRRAMHDFNTSSPNTYTAKSRNEPDTKHSQALRNS